MCGHAAPPHEKSREDTGGGPNEQEAVMQLRSITFLGLAVVFLGGASLWGLEAQAAGSGTEAIPCYVCSSVCPSQGSRDHDCEFVCDGGAATGCIEGAGERCPNPDQYTWDCHEEET